MRLNAHLSSEMHYCVHLFGHENVSNKVCGLNVALDKLHFPQASTDTPQKK